MRKLRMKELDIYKEYNDLKDRRVIMPCILSTDEWKCCLNKEDFTVVNYDRIFGLYLIVSKEFGFIKYPYRLYMRIKVAYARMIVKLALGVIRKYDNFNSVDYLNRRMTLFDIWKLRKELKKERWKGYN